MIFGYDGEISFNKEIIIESIGNVCLEANDVLGRQYYLWIKTTCGVSTILEFGPIYRGDELISDNYDISFRRMDYSDAGLSKVISNFFRPRKGIVGNKKVPIVEVNFVDYDLALTYGIDPFKYLLDYNETSNY